MTKDSFWTRVEDVLHLVKEYSERHRRPGSAVITPGRLSRWASLIGGILFVGGEVLRQLGDPDISSVRVAYVALSIPGLAIFFAGVIAGLVEVLRMMRRPFVEHVDRAMEAQNRELELLAALERFDSAVLQAARMRLQPGFPNTNPFLIAGR